MAVVEIVVEAFVTVTREDLSGRPDCSALTRIPFSELNIRTLRSCLIYIDGSSTRRGHQISSRIAGDLAAGVGWTPGTERFLLVGGLASRRRGDQ